MQEKIEGLLRGELNGVVHNGCRGKEIPRCVGLGMKCGIMYRERNFDARAWDVIVRFAAKANSTLSDDRHTRRERVSSAMDGKPKSIREVWISPDETVDVDYVDADFQKLQLH